MMVVGSVRPAAERHRQSASVGRGRDGSGGAVRRSHAGRWQRPQLSGSGRGRRRHAGPCQDS